MPIDLTCAKCGRYFQVAALDNGQVLECPACGTLHEPAALQKRPPEASPETMPELRRDLEPHRGPLIMVLGIVSLVMIGFLPPVGIPFGIVAWVMGHKDLKKIKKKEMDPDGESKTNAGRLCGLVGTLISTVVTLFICVIYGFIFGMMFTVGPVGRAPRPAPPPKAIAPAPPPAPKDIGPMPLENEKPSPP
jgi:hypothetical protein